MNIPLVPSQAHTQAGFSQWLRTVVSSIAAGWHVEHDGAGRHKFLWTNVPFDANRFTGSGSMTWTVASADQAVWAYVEFGKIMLTTFDIRATTVATPNNALQLVIPNGRQSAYTTAVGTYAYSDNGTPGIGIASVGRLGRTIFLYQSLGAPSWAASTDNTRVQGMLAIPIV